MKAVCWYGKHDVRVKDVPEPRHQRARSIMISEETPESPKAITVTVQLGNTDNRLKQIEWHAFVVAVKGAIEQSADSIHFFGAPANREQIQNVAWVFALDRAREPQLKSDLEEIRKDFKQEAIAWTSGTTLFI